MAEDHPVRGVPDFEYARDTAECDRHCQLWALRNPERVEIAPQGRTVEKVDQRVYFVNSATKRALLSHLLADESLERVIVFTRTKRGANRVAEALEDRGVVSEAIHGNKSQNARQKALDNFSRGKARVLVVLG